MSRRGVVEIRDHLVREIEDPRYRVNWQPYVDRRATFVDTAFDDLDEAIEWGRARAPRVFVDLEEEPWNRIRYAIGVKAASVQPWPHELAADPPRVARYRGAVYVHDDARWTRTGFIAVHHEGDEEVERKHHAHDLEAAIDWGRERAPIVIVEILPTSFQWPPPPTPRRYSAGDEDPPDEELPRLRPRPPTKTMQWRATFDDGVEYALKAPTRDAAESMAVDRYVREIVRPLEGGAFTFHHPEIEPVD